MLYSNNELPSSSDMNNGYMAPGDTSKNPIFRIRHDSDNLSNSRHGSFKIIFHMKLFIIMDGITYILSDLHLHRTQGNKGMDLDLLHLVLLHSIHSTIMIYFIHHLILTLLFHLNLKIV